MPRKSDYYQDFLQILGEREKVIQRKRNKILVFSLSILSFYILVALLFSSKLDKLSFLDFMRSADSRRIDTQSLEILKLQGEVEDMKKVLLTISENKNPSYNYLNSKIVTLESRNEYLYQTILNNPDSAITPKILREEQNNLDEKVQDVKKQIDRTNSLLASIFVALMIAIACFVGRQIWLFLSNRNLLKE